MDGVTILKEITIKYLINITKLYPIHLRRLMAAFTIRFSVTCETKFGEVVYICGNTSELGNWNPEIAMRLYTDTTLYPKWDPYKSILVR